MHERQNGHHHSHEHSEYRSQIEDDGKDSTSEASSRSESTSLSESEKVFFDAPATFTTPARKKLVPFRLPVMSPFEEESFKTAKMMLQLRQASEKLPSVATNLKKLAASLHKCEDLVFHIREESSQKDWLLIRVKNLLATLSSLFVIALAVKIFLWRRRLTAS